jgi:hypothetical protein
MIQIHEIIQGSDEWLKLREGLYTGSNADKLLSFSSHVKIVNGIASSYALAEITSFRGNFFTKRGHILEDEAIELYEDITGHQVSRPGFVTNTKYPNCGYSPDGHDDTLGIPLEVKCFNEAKHRKMFAGDIEMKVLGQIHFGQLLWEKKGARLLIYNPDIEDDKFCFKIIEVKYNRNIQNNFKRILSPKAVTT